MPLLRRAVFICGAVVVALCVGACTPVARPVPTPTGPRAAEPVVPDEFHWFARALRAHPSSMPASGTAWYPTYLPAGFTFRSIATTTLAQGSAPVCEVVFAQGAEEIILEQGSPELRDYGIESTGRVPWGGATAETVDATGKRGGPVFIVYRDQRNLAQLSGDVSADELRRIAARMRTVP